jgi:hypothetical protein
MLILSLLTPEAALAQKLNPKDALQIITDFADRLCLTPPLEGSGSTVELSGVAKAELDGLLKRMAALGIQGSAKFQQSQFRGLLQKDLVAALKTSTDCKLKVLDALKDKLLSNVSAPTADEVADAAAKRARLLTLTFTNAPPFTRGRRDRITQEWSAFYHYLDGVGFDLPKEVPPLRTRQGNAMAMARISPSIDESHGHIGIPEQWLDDAEQLRNVYAVWLFRKLFGLLDSPPWLESQGQQVHIATSLFACYYRSSFVNQNVCDHDWIGRGWNNRLWNVRAMKGQNYTDRALFATYKGWAWARPEGPEGSFDEFFGVRFLYGLSLIHPAKQDIEEIRGILQGAR